MPTASSPLKRGQSGSRHLNGTFQPLTGNSFTLATLPSAALHVGRVVYCTNGNAGAATAAISDGANWKVLALGATVS